ncbi:uncharacterized protein LOC8263311 [Ricinus communis]|uniref:Uncharacterized protein n=1 Tax=Ricinus communis TaxID=3988 RepID=B9SCX7_RICCO|nr:uncharacterized protein LOC8263311 [Ricinus communis]EEF38572.1 conserved hypothetical protein [Ricinus communis]|eukprot:XP_002523846.1 uncharacterized protein LOC8263311 [Ricinus communis]
METLSSISCFSTSNKSPFNKSSPKPLLRRNPPKVSFFRASPNPVRELAEEDVLRMFLKEREVNGDFISKASDMFWLREVMELVDFDAAKLADNSQEAEQIMESQDEGGFLKLTRTQEWISGADSAPMNKKAIAKAMQDDSDRRKKLNFLKYEALKRELIFLSVGIGTACTGYCLIALSVQAAISYAIGVLFSCLYLQLLCKHADNLSREMIPPIFMKKKSKKIGIRSEDLSESIERSIKGSGMALSSPRLMIPAAVYGLWVLSHHYFSNDIFDFQIVPAMFGMFVYKAAALVQVYRDNEDLQFLFPEDGESSSD